MVNGTGGLTFYNVSYLTFREKGMSIYVQMDKGIYKPGQKGNAKLYFPISHSSHNTTMIG